MDSFPTRPSDGNRILRLFTNINPRKPRVWNTADTFDALAPRYAGFPGLPMPEPLTPVRRTLLGLGRPAGLTIVGRSPYDRWMLRFHNSLKKHEEFQRNTQRRRCEFPPGSPWLVFTDMVAHAVLSGQFALKQTFIIARKSLLTPEKAPVTILERLAGGALTTSQ